MRRLVSLLILTGILMLLFVPAVAAGGEVAEEGVKAEVTTDVVPALEQDLFIPADAEIPAWTYRFMIPLLIALTLAAVAGTTVQYFMRVVRPRYQPAE